MFKWIKHDASRRLAGGGFLREAVLSFYVANAILSLYDVLTAQPSLDAHQIQRRQMKLAMAVGDNNHYRVNDIHGRHFLQIFRKAGLPDSLVRAAIEEISDTAEGAIQRLGSEMPTRFPEQIHISVKQALTARLRSLMLS